MNFDARTGDYPIRAKRDSAESAAPRVDMTPDVGARRIGRTRVLWFWLRRRRPTLLPL